MTNIFWNASLPQRPRLGAEETFVSDLASFQPDIGEALTRRRSTVEISQLNVTYVMNQSQLAIFRDFYSKSISKGALSFYIPHPHTGEQVKVKIQTFPVVRHIATTRWDVSFTLQVIKT